MLTGLLFATHDAEDRPDRLTATLPFGGATLIEHQARQLIAAGASQIIVMVARPSPELNGALSRIGRRGVAVDPVRSAREAAEKLHPLARVAMMADGLVTTDAAVGALAAEGGDALLVTTGVTAPAGFERVGGGMAWAGLARLSPARVTEVAALPRDYDPQSTLVRVAEAAGAAHVPLTDAALRDGHGIEHAGRAIEERGRRVLAATVSARRNWFERYVVGPLARIVVPPLVARLVSGAVIAAGASALGLVGLLALWLGWPRPGILLALAGTLAFAIGDTLSGLRGEPALVRAQALGACVLPALSALLLARELEAATGDRAAMMIALGLIVLGALGERAIRDRRGWWGGPAAYLLVVTLAVLPGWPLAGLALAAIYAAATLAAAIEVLRRQA